jgi:hypothetical protein
VITKKYTSITYTYSNPPHPMYHISVQEFKEHVRLSHSWSELAHRCGNPLKYGRFGTAACVKTLRQKVLFLKLDTQHFMGIRQGNQNARARRVWIATVLKQCVCVRWTGDVGVLTDC